MVLMTEKHEGAEESAPYFCLGRHEAKHNSNKEKDQLIRAGPLC